MKTKGMLTAVLLIAATLLLQTTALAADVNYSGPINSFTGEAEIGTNSTSNADLVAVGSGFYYDRAKRVYTCDLGGSSGATVSANVMDGMIVNEAVTVTVSKGLDVRVYRDGALVDDVNLELVEEPGRYVLEANVQGNQYSRVMSFTVVGDYTGLINSYPMPSGFIIKGVNMSVQNENGEWVAAQPQWDRDKVSMSRDGSYEVQYECVRNGMSYTLKTVIDHTPPALALENVVNGLARGPVDISDLEQGCKIGITLNGGKMSYREELTLSGDYKIVLQDQAGNLANYEFTIMVYLDANSWIFFALVVVVVAATVGYLYMERKRLRVR